MYVQCWSTFGESWSLNVSRLTVNFVVQPSGSFVWDKWLWSMKVLKLYLFAFGVVCVAARSPFDISERDVRMANAIVDAIHSNLANRTTTLSVRALCKSDENQFIQNEIIGNILLGSNGQISFVHSITESRMGSRSKYHLILLDEYKSIRYVCNWVLNELLIKSVINLLVNCHWGTSKTTSTFS